MQHEERMVRQVRAIHNYQVGQKARVGVVVLIAGLAAGVVYFLAYAISMTQQILAGLHAH